MRTTPFFSRVAAAGLLAMAASAAQALTFNADITLAPTLYFTPGTPVGLAVQDATNNSVFSFGNLETEWTTTRSVTFTDSTGSVTATSYKAASASPAVSSTGFSLEQVSPVSKPVSFAGLTNVATSSLGFADGESRVALPTTGYGNDTRVALGGTLADDQTVVISASTSTYGYFQTEPTAGQSLGDTISVGVTGTEYFEPYFASSDLLTTPGIRESLPGSFTASVSYSVFRIGTGGALEQLYTSEGVDPFGLPVTGSFSFKVGDKLVFLTEAELSLTVSGATVVPEPGTLGLALLGLGGIAAVARRRRV